LNYLNCSSIETPRNERQARHGAIYFAERAGRLAGNRQ
jgi:hypothetical protein